MSDREAEAWEEDAAAPEEEDAAAPEQEVSLLREQVAEAQQAAAAHREDLQRVAAEFDNYRKRVVREQAQQVDRASQRVVAAMLPVLDSFDLALAHEASSPSEQKLLEGMERTYVLLMDVLGREGLEVLPAVGVPFDPQLHEAVSTTGEPGGETLVVADELRRGYRLRGRVIRPALVSVAGREEAGEGDLP